MKNLTFLITASLLYIACTPTNDKKYSFFVAGHISGKPGAKNQGLHPPFMEQKDTLHSLGLKFGVLLGDIVQADPTDENWDLVDSDIDSLGLKTHFVVGNHDMQNRALYEKRYGSTYYTFFYQNDLFIVLDANIDNWNIYGDQLLMLKNELRKIKPSSNIFVFTHQLIWINHPEFNGLKPNSLSGKSSTLNFWDELFPLFQNLSNNVFFIAGDVGAGKWSSDNYFKKIENCTFIATGMGEGKGDNYYIIDVSETAINSSPIFMN